MALNIMLNDAERNNRQSTRQVPDDACRAIARSVAQRSGRTRQYSAPNVKRTADSINGSEMPLTSGSASGKADSRHARDR